MRLLKQKLSKKKLGKLSNDSVVERFQRYPTMRAINNDEFEQMCLVDLIKRLNTSVDIKDKDDMA